MTEPARPTLTAAWPALAAGLAALVGMGSCRWTIMPLTILGAPVVAVAISLAAFVALLPLVPPSPTPLQRRRQLRLAALVAFAVSVATCWWMGSVVNSVMASASAPPKNVGMDIVGVMTGVVLGAIIAPLMLVLGTAHFRRRALAEPLSVASPTGGRKTE